MSILFFLATISLQPDSLGAETAIIMEESISGKFANTRAIVEVFSKENGDVMNGCDQFFTTLQQKLDANEISEHDVKCILSGVAFSAEKHQHQTRKNIDQTPYIIHPIAVANHLATVGHVNDANILIGALLHDTIEDTNTTFDEIGTLFGPVIEGYVREVTDDKSLPKEERKRLQIENAPHKSPGAAQIKLADKFHNLSQMTTNPPSDWSKERLDSYYNWAKQVVDRLPQVNDPLKQAVDEVIANYWKTHNQ